MSKVVNFGLRGAQVVFSTVVLGLSISLIKGQKIPGSLPATLGYAAFVGGISLAAAFVGIAASFVELLQGLIGIAVDILILLLNIAGGVTIAVKLKGLDCGGTDNLNRALLALNELINGGWVRLGGDDDWPWYVRDPPKLNSRCKENQANAAFMFLTVVILIASATLSFLHMRRK